MEDYTKEGQKKEIFYRYGENGSVDIEIDKDGDGIIDRKRVYTYGSLGRLEEIETKVYAKDEKEPMVDKIEILYSQEEDIDDSSKGQKDIYQLIKSETSRATIGLEIGREGFESLFGGEYEPLSLEYHEEHDAYGKKIFSYTRSSDSMRRSFRYAYDDEGSLLSKTLIDYGYGRRNSTTYYTPSGQIKEVYVQSEEEKQVLEEERKKWYQEKLSQFKKEYRKIVEDGIYVESLKIPNKLLKRKTFHQKLIKAYRYNEDGRIAEEFDNREQNITYRYDIHGNLIEKRRGDRVLLKQKFMVCE